MFSSINTPCVGGSIPSLWSVERTVALLPRHVVISRKKATDTGSLLTHFICFSFRSIIYEAKGGELYNSRVERLLAEYLIDMLPVEFLPLPCLCALDSILEAWPL